MSQRRIEIFVVFILALIGYFGDYYLKEPSITSFLRHTLIWNVLNILWLLLMVVIGYLGLLKHEIKWVKALWLLVNAAILIVLFANKVVEYLWHQTFIPEATSTVIRTPFFFVMAAFLPRWFNLKKPTGKK